MQILYVIPDYYSRYPKPCMGGWAPHKYRFFAGPASQAEGENARDICSNGFSGGFIGNLSKKPVLERGWARQQLVIAPNGNVLPCSAAHLLSLPIENVRHHPLTWIWEESVLFNRFRGDDWMAEPCRSCSRRTIDFGGCRCQAFQLTGDATVADPVCHLSPHHAMVEEAVRVANEGDGGEAKLVYRSERA